jgi:NAD(P)-dependent dehydrogenase (short-subunit alcohol dehydrogenase family)
VTGAARGIGLGIATVLATRGDHVILADLDAGEAETQAERLRAEGRSARAVALDVTDADEVRDVMAAVDAETPLSVVVCNAGVAFSAPLVEVDVAAFDRLMAVNVRGVFLVLQAALRAMLPRGAGSVVTLCSTSSFTASTGPLAVYDASKGAVKLLTQAAAREVAGTGVRVNGVAPGTLETDLTRGLATSEQLDDLARARIPLGRLGKPAEIGAAVAFLASDDASYITGAVLAVDGGWLA